MPAPDTPKKNDFLKHKADVLDDLYGDRNPDKNVGSKKAIETLGSLYGLPEVAGTPDPDPGSPEDSPLTEKEKNPFKVLDALYGGARENQSCGQQPGGVDSAINRKMEIPSRIPPSRTRDQQQKSFGSHSTPGTPPDAPGKPSVNTGMNTRKTSNSYKIIAVICLVILVITGSLLAYELTKGRTNPPGTIQNHTKIPGTTIKDPIPTISRYKPVVYQLDPEPVTISSAKMFDQQGSDSRDIRTFTFMVDDFNKKNPYLEDQNVCRHMANSFWALVRQKGYTAYIVIGRTGDSKWTGMDQVNHAWVVVRLSKNKFLALDPTNDKVVFGDQIISTKSAQYLGAGWYRGYFLSSPADYENFIALESGFNGLKKTYSEWILKYNDNVDEFNADLASRSLRGLSDKEEQKYNELQGVLKSMKNDLTGMEQDLQKQKKNFESFMTKIPA